MDDPRKRPRAMSMFAAPVFIDGRIEPGRREVGTGPRPAPIETEANDVA